MSKYGKALDKLQEERQEKAAAAKKSGFKIPPAEDIPAGNIPYWERGIKTMKNTEPDERVVMLRFPDSMVAEQYRMLRTSLKAQLVKDGAKAILVSSSIHSEGKTLTAVNLAVALAEHGDAKVALIDADLRRGKVADYLGFGRKQQGLSDLLAQGLPPKQLMIRNSVPNLLVMPRGQSVKKAAELIGSPHFRLMIAELRSHFDYILIDAPPIMSVADAGILARETDGVLFVIQVGRTPKSVIAHAHQLFKQANAKILGHVLTHVEYQSADYRYYNYYYGSTPDPKGNMKKIAEYRLKEAGKAFKQWEEKFNRWWEESILKRKIREKISKMQQRLGPEPKKKDFPNTHAQSKDLL